VEKNFHRQGIFLSPAVDKKRGNRLFIKLFTFKKKKKERVNREIKTFPQTFPLLLITYFQGVDL